MSSVICTFPKLTDPSKFKTGEEITLRGECSGFLMDVLLNNCSIVVKKKVNTMSQSCKNTYV